MLSALASEHPVVSETFATASDVLDYDLWQLVSEGPEEDLNQTDRTQPAMLAAGVATWRVFQQQHAIRPEIMAGHSLGEYTALVCAGSLAFEDAVGVVADRGRFMQEAVPAGSGAMAAILGLDDDKVTEVCRQSALDEVLSPVNFNSPGQVVIAGNTEAVNRAAELARSCGAKRAIILPVSVPSHCALMKPAADRLKERLDGVQFAQPDVPVIHNTVVEAYVNGNEIRNALVSQLFSPVRWVETIRYFGNMGVDILIECGPGKVLTGLNKRIDREMAAFPVFDPATLGKATAAIA
ncbi:MAG: ACP S-malonyltransferase [Gammaproteobacteria bacterium]|nr:MAG: ACP S-malonyltransferase [Gammaproteobacteria bacterium]